MTTEELVTIQTEIKKLRDDFDAYRADWLGAKVRFLKLADNFTSNVAAPTQQEVPQLLLHQLQLQSFHLYQM